MSEENSPDSEPVNLLQLLRYAEEIGSDAEATIIALQVYEINKNTFNLSMVGNNLIPHLIISEKFSEAINLALNSSLYLFAMQVFEKVESNLPKPESEEDIRKILSNQPETFCREIDRSTVVFSLIPVLLELGNSFVFDHKLAAQQAEEVYLTCLDISKKAYLPELWRSVAEIIKGIFNENYSFQQLIEMGDQFSRENNHALKHICLLGGTLQKDVIPENAIYTHIIIFQEIVRSFMAFPFMYRQIAVAFFKNYWNHKFNNNRFRFKNPVQVQEQLNSAFNLPPEKSIQNILYTVITNLNIPYDQEYIEGLIS
jgi:hypothetical protein